MYQKDSDEPRSDDCKRPMNARSLHEKVPYDLDPTLYAGDSKLSIQMQRFEVALPSCKRENCASSAR